MWDKRTKAEREAAEREATIAEWATRPELWLEKKGVFWQVVNEEGLVYFSGLRRQNVIDRAHDGGFKVSW